MPNYKKMYHKTFNALTDAERLISEASAVIKAAQSACEDEYINASPFCRREKRPVKSRPQRGGGKIG